MSRTFGVPVALSLPPTDAQKSYLPPIKKNACLSRSFPAGSSKPDTCSTCRRTIFFNARLVPFSLYKADRSAGSDEAPECMRPLCRSSRQRISSTIDLARLIAPLGSFVPRCSSRLRFLSHTYALFTGPPSLNRVLRAAPSTTLHVPWCSSRSAAPPRPSAPGAIDSFG